MIQLRELHDYFDDACLQGDDVEIQGITEPGLGDSVTAEIWMQGEPSGQAPLIIDSSLDAKQASSVLKIPDLSGKLRELLSIFRDSDDADGIHPSSVISNDFSSGENVQIGPFVHIGPNVSVGKNVQIDSSVVLQGNVSLGDHVHLHSGVKVVSPADIGNSTVIHSNSVIGSDGFGYEQENGEHRKVPQIGSVKIGQNVEIGANCAIDRATFGQTVIENGTKLDNQVHVAHNTKIGQDCLLVAKSGTAGSSELKDRVWIGGQSAVTDHVTLAEDVKVASRSGVTKDIKTEGKIVSGFPARNHQDVMKQKAVVSKLPELRERLRNLENTVNNSTEEDS